MAHTISFDARVIDVRNSASLRTSLNKLSASLATVSSAGAGAQAVLQDLQSSLRATAAATGKATRSLAKFDEINKLSARTGTSGSGKTSAAKQQEQPTVWQNTLSALRSAWDAFWTYLQTRYAPAIAAWTAAWSQLRAAALAVWQDLMGGISAAWAEHGQGILTGLSLAVQNLGTLLSSLWSTVLQPVLAQLAALLGQLWAEHLKPLWDNLVMVLASLTELVLTVWNQVLTPLLNWLISTLGPVFVQVYGIVAQAVAGAVGVVADCVNTALTLLGGLADYVTLVLQGDWLAAWLTMSETVSRVWSQIVATVRGAVETVLGVVRSLLEAFRSVGSTVTGWFGGGDPSAAVVQSGFTMRVPALAAGAVIPPNREFLALLGDQRSGTNIEAPLDTLKQAFAETLARMGGGNDQPINIYIGEELLDSVIAGSQNRRRLRSGGR